jgi:hypothetical protein
MKITAKQFAGFKRAMTATGFNGISFNDNWNKQAFGITKAQHDALGGVASDMLGMDARQVTLVDVKRYLDGEKVHLSRCTPDRLRAVEVAFPG